MTHQIILVAAEPATHPVTPAFLNRLTPDEVQILEDGKALRGKLSSPLCLKEIRNLRESLTAHKIDVFQVPNSADMPQPYALFLADMDSTIVVGETLDELSAYAGVKEQVAAITTKAMNGEIDFQDALRERVGLLKNLPESALQETAKAIHLMNGATELLAALKTKEIFTVLVTGGFTYFADTIATKAGFDAVHGNQLELEGDVLTGQVIPPILDKEAKLSFLRHYSAERNITPAQTIAIGDGANDLPMLEAAGLGIGYHPKPLLQERLVNVILHNDLRAVSYLL